MRCWRLLSIAAFCLLNQRTVRRITSDIRRAKRMCQLCIDIDKRIERYREQLRSIADLAEIERINRRISQLYAERVRLHRSTER
jgi:hypothetical protein